MLQVLFEIYSFGEKPYKDWGNGRVWLELQAGSRLPRPNHCPESVYGIMRACWQEARPFSFPSLAPPSPPPPPLPPTPPLHYYGDIFNMVEAREPT